MNRCRLQLVSAARRGACTRCTMADDRTFTVVTLEPTHRFLLLGIVSPQPLASAVSAFALKVRSFARHTICGACADCLCAHGAASADKIARLAVWRARQGHGARRGALRWRHCDCACCEPPPAQRMAGRQYGHLGRWSATNSCHCTRRVVSISVGVTARTRTRSSQKVLFRHAAQRAVTAAWHPIARALLCRSCQPCGTCSHRAAVDELRAASRNETKT